MFPPWSRYFGLYDGNASKLSLGEREGAAVSHSLVNELLPCEDSYEITHERGLY